MRETGLPENLETARYDNIATFAKVTNCFPAKFIEKELFPHRKMLIILMD
jgi:hypothetical protein